MDVGKLNSREILGINFHYQGDIGEKLPIDGSNPGIILLYGGSEKNHFWNRIPLLTQISNCYKEDERYRWADRMSVAEILKSEACKIVLRQSSFL